MFNFQKVFIHLLLFLSVPVVFAQKLTQKIPEWYEHQAVVYPPAFYITAVGEGKTREEAETAALATISLYFQTTTDVCNDLLKRYNENERGDSYSVFKDTQITEKARVTSQSEFFGVQFAQGFVVDKKFTTLAFIERASAFDVYRQRINTNLATIKSLLLIAEDYNNPIFGFEAAAQGLPVVNLTEQLVKMARLTKKVDSNYFAEAEIFFERMKNAYQISKSNLIFKISVENDFEGMILRTLSDLLEDGGYSVSQTNGVCTLPVKVTVDKNQSSGGTFLYCGLVVNLATGTGEKIFSYSRNFPKKGAPTEQMAYRRAYQAIQKELQDSFMAEFEQKIRIRE